jgi:hypothetical protein
VLRPESSSTARACSTLIRRYGIVPEQLLPLALQMCSALHDMARRGVVHLDLSRATSSWPRSPAAHRLSVAHRRR